MEDIGFEYAFYLWRGDAHPSLSDEDIAELRKAGVIG